MSKTEQIWWETRLWCESHPGQKAAIVTKAGTFILTYKPKV